VSELADPRTTVIMARLRFATTDTIHIIRMAARHMATTDLNGSTEDSLSARAPGSTGSEAASVIVMISDSVAISADATLTGAGSTVAGDSTTAAALMADEHSSAARAAAASVAQPEALSVAQAEAVSEARRAAGFAVAVEEVSGAAAEAHVVVADTVAIAKSDR